MRIALAADHAGYALKDELVAWLREQAPETVPATGKRTPGGKGDKVLEDAPGRYVAMR